MKSLYSFFFILAFIFFLTACKSESKKFSFEYSMENFNNYKIILNIDHTMKYRIEEQRMYFDRQAHQRKPVITEGKLTDQDFKIFNRHLSKSNLFHLKDSYGFDRERANDALNILYQLSYRVNEKQKIIIIQYDPATEFPKDFLQLKKYLDDFISLHKQDDKS